MSLLMESYQSRLLLAVKSILEDTIFHLLGKTPLYLAKYIPEYKTLYKTSTILTIQGNKERRNH